ncbi:hypothetical protein CDAR_620651 [Caerostris darwini]|uniref:Uncharacterized protein n=1 Tax=Caerostris darwini TaxID=1538125 RepID=A0AAV4NIX9_9ARAC|nr:hypothetical protein CDAR_620651 [Caerostris darwini]
MRKNKFESSDSPARSDSRGSGGLRRGKAEDLRITFGEQDKSDVQDQKQGVLDSKSSSKEVQEIKIKEDKGKFLITNKIVSACLMYYNDAG